MLNLLTSLPDLHVNKAMELYAVPAHEVTPTMRQVGKMANFINSYRGSMTEAEAMCLAQTFRDQYGSLWRAMGQTEFCIGKARFYQRSSYKLVAPLRMLCGTHAPPQPQYTSKELLQPLVSALYPIDITIRR